MINLIKQQLALIYNGDPWYGPSIKTVLKSVDFAYVYDSPGPEVHSIAELVAHMINWRIFAVQRLRGETDYLPEQEQTFAWQQFSLDKKSAWNAMKKRLGANQQQLLILLDQRNNSILEQTVADKSYTFRYLLNGLIQHDAYHLGQIVYIHKLLAETNNNLPEKRLLEYSHDIFSYQNLALLK